MKLKYFALIATLMASVTSHSFAETLKQLNMVYVKSPFNLQCMVMKNHNMLEKAFEKEGITIKWHDINSGAQQAQAMASGDIDISAVMNTASVLISNGAGNPITIISGVSHPADTFAIVGKPGEKLDIKSLKGKKIAGPRGTVLHQLLVAALQKEGMSLNDVEFISMGLPQALAAVTSGQVDAALLAASLVIKAQNEGCKVVTTAKGLVNVNLVMAAREAFAKEHSDVVQKVVDIERQALEWIQAHPNEAIALGAKEHGISLEDAKMLASWSNYYQTLNEADVKGLEADQQFLLDNKLMEKAVDIKSIIWPTAFQK